jgi:hypothetical protein
MKYSKFLFTVVLLVAIGCDDYPVKAKKESKLNSNVVDFRYQPRYWQTCFGLKDDYYKSMIDNNGGLWYDFAWGNHIGFPYDNYCYERNIGYTIALFPQLINAGHNHDNIQNILSPDKPIVENNTKYGDLHFSQRVFASFADEENQLDSRYDVVMVNVKNNGEKVLPYGFRLEINTIHQVELDETGKKVFLLKKDKKELLCTLSHQVDRFAGHISKMKYTYYLDIKAMDIQPGKNQLYSFIVQRSQGVRISENWSLEKDLERVKQYWENQKLPYHYIQVPDSGIQALLHSSIRNIYQAREIKNGIPAFQVGPTFYRGTWAVDGPFFMEAMTYLGQKEQVRAAIEGVFAVGETQGDRGESFSKQAGLRIWMVWRHAQLTGDYDWLEKSWGLIESEVQNIERYRANSYKDGNPLTDGLMPIGNADGGIGGIYAEYTNNYWALSGLQFAIKASERIGKTSTANDWKELFNDYYDAFNKARQRDQLTDEYGNTYVPTFMGHNTLNTTTGQWAFMHSVFPGKLYDIEDELMHGTMNMLDSNLTEGLIWGTGWLPKGLWTYSASFHGHAHLWLGNGRRVPDILYDFANHASPLLCWSEEQHPIDFEGDYLEHGDMPHNWASAEFIRLIRHSLVLERGENLHLFEGIPGKWLKPGSITRINEMPTEFGILSIELAVNETGTEADLKLFLDDEKHIPPSKIIIDLKAFGGSSKELTFENKIELTIPVDM